MNNQDQTPFFQKVSIWLPFLLAAVLTLGMFIGLRVQSALATHPAGSSTISTPTRSSSAGKMDEILRYIDAKYVSEADQHQLMEKAVESVIAELDPHSNYFSTEELQAVQESMQGNFDGIGVEFMVLDDTIVIVTPLSGGPSEAVGLQPGDKIITIEDSIVAGQQLATADIFSLLRGEKGTKVRIGIQRAGETDLMDFTITRDEIPVHSVDVALMLDDRTGFIKVNRFSATTYDEFANAVKKLVEEHEMKDLVIDLRGNPGGYLTQATNMLSQLFPEAGKLLVYTEGRTEKRTEYQTNGRPFYRIEEVVVLIDEGSASASEIMAGAIQDHDRGVLIGRRSFGKGLVQNQYPLRDGSALRLTVARYYTPSGRCIQKEYEEGDASYNQDLEDRFRNGELSAVDSINIADSTQYFTANGHPVYGGGGITPDIFIPIDTIQLREDYLRWRQYAAGFIFRYVEENEDLAQNYTQATFIRDYRVTNAVYQDFLAYAKAQGETAAEPRLSAVQLELKRFLKARLSRQLFGQGGFFEVWNREDPMVRRALQVLGQDDPLATARQEK